ncbi:MAG: hypothetical protein FD152_1950 [Xanthobacteraceae bacterium]|nr:MAG: hypothetical protein FD152_1950 [Xanthobacteraceae bacterium]
MRLAPVLMSACLAGLIRATAAAGAAELGEVRDFNDWMVGCDNVRVCRAHGFPAGGASGGFGLRVDRDAEGPARPRLYVSLDLAWEAPTAGSVTFATEQGPIRTLPFGAAFRHGEDALKIADPELVQAVLRALRRNRELRVTFSPAPKGADEPVPAISLSGASAALLWMDERQQRIGTVSSLAQPGNRSAGTLRAMRPPSAPAPRPLTRGDVPPSLSPAARAAVMERFRSELDRICDLDEEPGSSEDTGSAEEGLRVIHRLTGDTLLVGVRCWRGAYNLSRAYYLVTDGATPVVRPASFPQPLARQESETEVPDNILTNVELDAKTGRITHFSKGRGIGDCGERGEWGWDGTAFRPVSLHRMPHCRGVIEAWFSLYQTR